MGLSRVRQCVRCKRIYDRKSNEWKKVHPFVISYMQTRADDYTLEVCPACQKAEQICKEQQMHRHHEFWTELVEVN